MRIAFIVALAVTTATTACAGSLNIEVVREGPNRIWLLSAVPDVGETFRGFEASFVGPMIQQTAFGMPTPFTDLDQFLPDGGLEDSKFLFSSGDVLTTGAEETSTSLVGSMTSLPDGVSDFARIVPEDFGRVDLDIRIDFGGQFAQQFGFVLLGFPSILPEPTSAATTILCLATMAGMRRSAA